MEKIDIEKEKQKYRFSHEIQVQFRDLDAMGHVNNAVFFSYFEIVRTAYFEELGLPLHKPITDFKDFPFILLETSCKFLSPALFLETLVFYARVSRIGNKSFDMEYLVTSKTDGRLVAMGKSTQVHYDYKTGKTTRLPDWMRKRFEEFEGKALEG